MKALLKNWLSPNNRMFFITKSRMSQWLILLFIFVFPFKNKSQIANYVNNGGFEVPNINNMQLPLYWNAIDTNKFMGILLSENISPFLVPSSSYTYQWPRHGKNFLIGTEYFTTCSNQSCVGYPRNKLKQNLQSGKTYCIKMYVNLSNQSSYAIDAIGVYFADNTTDTITHCTLPITYLIPQIQNPTGNIISDTLNWTLITGTYTAIGTEKYLMLGNFKTDANTNKTMVNPANLPAHFSGYCYDDISIIDIDLNADAGHDSWQVPGDSSFIGRQPDVGIDEACTWYKLPNTTTPIDTVAGLWVKPALTTTYVVKQDICGNIKYDTVVVHQSALGIKNQSFEINSIKIFPNPVQDVLQVQLTSETKTKFNKIEILNSLGQIVREEEIIFKNKMATIKTEDLPNGVYTLQLKFNNSKNINKRFIITR